MPIAFHTFRKLEINLMILNKEKENIILPCQILTVTFPSYSRLKFSPLHTIQI